ncbi:hypothetical protein GL279_17985 [Paracoccus limosus]|uniref:Pyridoxamine 5'-phosphate oxidase putative domain-containing protein n=1 Tax=Paracoccus limosus TaxID=913252 RepID=A0A844HAB7_9RHOB|nr:hypothetical protein [Paracoccus limosus]MTH36481.1 hypothetical protein [Paracoccus limosus]
MPPSLVRFLSRPVMIILGSVDATARPEIARAVGASVDPQTGVIELVVSRWQWPATIANIGASGRIAATFSRPADYETYQIKGRATWREAGAADHEIARAYCRDMLAALMELGMAPGLIAHWQSDRDLVVISLTPDQVFIQTPGPMAGQRIGGTA